MAYLKSLSLCPENTFQRTYRPTPAFARNEIQFCQVTKGDVVFCHQCVARRSNDNKVLFAPEMGLKSIFVCRPLHGGNINRICTQCIQQRGI